MTAACAEETQAADGSMAESALEFRGVTKRYGRRWALNGFDLAVRRGSVTGLVGSNGAGKTTALSIAAGMIRPNRGTVSLLGEGPFDPIRHAGRVASLPQDCQPPSTAQVDELLLFYARLQGLARAEAARQVHTVLEWVRLSERSHAPIRTLSHGMRRRVLIAQAFLGDPELVLLDEPLSGLDPREVVNIRRLLRGKNVRQTVVISSHNLHEIELVCDEVVFIEQGKTVRQDSMETVMQCRQAVTYALAPATSEDRLPLAQLTDALPDAEFLFDAERANLVCRFSGLHTLATVNRAVIATLQAADIDIQEIRRGSGLEEVYLNQPISP